MEVFVTALIIGGILLITMMINEHHRQIVRQERLVTHKRIIASLERYRWLSEMGYRETANSFNMIY